MKNKRIFVKWENEINNYHGTPSWRELAGVQEKMVVEIEEEVLKQVQEKLAGLEKQVTLKFFRTGEDHCLFCNETAELVKIVANQSENVIVEECICETHEDPRAKEYGIDKQPAIVIYTEDLKNHRIRYFGIPSGYEFGSFIESILEAGTNLEVEDEIAEKLRSIDKPVHMQVFVTPTCPYCPGAVRTAHRFAMINSKITGDMVEAMEFQELSRKYRVMGVPKTIIQAEGGKPVFLEGAAPEEMFLAKILEALG
ncbi:MAG: thioredoxin family protein [Candidatus Heimdallarchaeota archaeon]